MKIRNNKGQATVLFAAAISALIGMTALVVDVGVLYVNRLDLQKALDVAVMAGAQELPTDAAGAVATAGQYAAVNGKANDSVALEVLNENSSLRAIGSRNVNLLFARIFGNNASVVTARARANVGVIVGYTGVVPFGLEQMTLNYGVDYILKAGGGDGNTGNFGALSLSGNGAKDYLYDIENGYQSPLRVGDIVSTKPGNISGPTLQGVNYRIQKDPTATFETVQSNSPRIIVIPIVIGDPQGRDTVEIAGFAAFFLEGVGGSGADNYVTGKFMREVLSGEIGVGTDFGGYGAKLAPY